MSEDIEKAIRFFKAQNIKVATITKAPMGSFDVFDICPEIGFKISKLSKHIDDFALYMGALSRPESEIDYAKGVFKINLQRRELGTLLLGDALPHLPKDMLCPVALGCMAKGGALIVDQGAIPNLLVAGAPGSGKSTLLKIMIENFLHSNVPVSIIDPKIVDFSSFKRRQNCNIESDPEKFGLMFDSEIRRMNTIYSILSSRGMSSVMQNNLYSKQKIFPHVIVIDEWSDVYSSDKKNLNRILTLSQKGRAAGISLVLATQRPSSTILPGQIKANFTGRIAMRVSSEMESRIIMNSSLAADIREPGLGYYMDQNNQTPIFFRVAKNNLIEKSQQNKPSFFSNILNTFRF